MTYLGITTGIGLRPMAPGNSLAQAVRLPYLFILLGLLSSTIIFNTVIISGQISVYNPAVSNYITLISSPSHINMPFNCVPCGKPFKRAAHLSHHRKSCKPWLEAQEVAAQRRQERAVLREEEDAQARAAESSKEALVVRSFSTNPTFQIVR